jgi:glycosyltransferase involved in cell wall biosynthesis
MKILIVSPKFHPVIGGGETYVLNSARLLQQMGLNVIVAVEPHPNRNIKSYPFEVREISGLSDSKLDILLAPDGLANLIEEFSPELIHVHGYFALLAVGLTNNHDIPIIASIHSTPVWGQRLIGGMSNFNAELHFVRSVLDLARPQFITAANGVYADAARKIAQDRVKVAVVPYPVDIDYFHRQYKSQYRKALGLKITDCLIITPSRIIERKGIKEVIHALGYLPENNYLCLPGAFDPLDKDYWNSICQSQFYKKVEHRVIIPKEQFLYEDMPALYGAADIVVMPSYYEGAPVATVEAMASGKPFVGADSQGINSFIHNNENGLLVPKKSIRELADAIIKLEHNAALRNRLSEQAYIDVGHLSWDLRITDLIQVYNEALEHYHLTLIQSAK